MKNCKEYIFWINYLDYIAYFKPDDYVDSQFDFKLVIENKNGEIKYMRKYDYEPDLLNMFELAYESINDNHMFWDVVDNNKKQCSKK